MSNLKIENNELKWNGVYCLGNKEYDKITVLDSPKDILTHLMKIPRPYESINGESDVIVNLDNDTWYQIQYAIKLIMDAYGIHVNWDKGLLMHDESRGNYKKEFDKLDENEKYWWLDKFKTQWDPDSKQTVTL